ncbi:MAG TPA: hypothetical protein VGD98_11710 [Ktedonobacteraceae bacterium]
MLQRSQRPGFIGHILAISGGVIALLAFLALPYISLGIFGSYTAIQLANGVYGSSTPSLWLELLVALAIIGLAGFALYKQSNTAPFSIVIMVLSGIALIYLGFNYLQQAAQKDLFGNSAASYYAAGFWFFLIGMAAALAGGIWQLSTANQARTSKQTEWPPQPPYSS